MQSPEYLLAIGIGIMVVIVFDQLIKRWRGSSTGWVPSPGGYTPDLPKQKEPTKSTACSVPPRLTKPPLLVRFTQRLYRRIRKETGTSFTRTVLNRHALLQILSQMQHSSKVFPSLSRDSITPTLKHAFKVINFGTTTGRITVTVEVGDIGTIDFSLPDTLTIEWVPMLLEQYMVIRPSSPNPIFVTLQGYFDDLSNPATTLLGIIGGWHKDSTNINAQISSMLCGDTMFTATKRTTGEYGDKDMQFGIDYLKVTEYQPKNLTEVKTATSR